VSFLLARDAPYFILDKTVVYAAAGARKASSAAGSPD